MNIALTLFLAAALLALCFLLPQSAHSADSIKVSGTGAALGAIRLIAAEFQKAKGISVTIAPSMGSSGGIKAAAEGALDVALASRPLKDEERKLGLSEVLYATTPFVPIAHAALPVKDITRADIARILDGSLSTWPNGERIRFVLRPASDIDSDILRSLSPEIARSLDVARSREGMLIALTDQANADMIESTQGAVGFSALSVVKSEKQRVKVLSLDSMPQNNPVEVAKAKGPRKALYAVTRNDASTAARAFVQFLSSPSSRKILENTGNLPAEPASR